MQITYILALLFALIVAIFAIQNAQPVTVDFMFNEFQVSLALVILVSVFAGAIILGFLGIFRQIRTGLKTREMASKIKKLEEQLKDTQGKLTESEENLNKLTDGLLGRENETKEPDDKPAECENAES